MIKQTLIMRKDLKMRRGKEISQGAHASMAWLTKRLQNQHVDLFGNVQAETYFEPHEWEWVKGLFTKICLQVDSEQELRDIYDKARAAGLVAELITDAGLTEFNGVPTVTCCAIGPDESEKIDLITGHLKLY